MDSAVARVSEGYQTDIAIREHRLTADEPHDKGGTDSGPKPTELLAASLASCTAITLLMYAERKEWDLGEVEVHADFEEATPDTPSSFEVKIKLGREEELSDQQRERLLVIASKCPVHKALAADDVTITDSLELLAS